MEKFMESQIEINKAVQKQLATRAEYCEVLKEICDLLSNRLDLQNEKIKILERRITELESK